jgi:ketosteroid isomerase-like protein
VTAYVLGLLLACSVASPTECDARCKERLIDDYFERIGRVFRHDSTEADIDRLFELFHDDVRYQHSEYDADFTKPAWKDAFIGNLKRGAYDKQANERIRVVRLIHGRQHTAVGYSYGAVHSNGEWKSSDGQVLLALFGFRGDKIVLVREYW